MPVVPIGALDDPRVADYRNVPDPILLRERGLFVAEGRLVIRMLLDRRSPRLVSLLVTAGALDALGGIEAVEAASAGLPVFVADKAAMSGLVGFSMTRGCLGLGERPPERAFDSLGVADPRCLVALEHTTNADNVGGVFRNAAAFGADAVLLSPTCCDPLYRKAIRVSAAATLRVPYAWLRRWPADLAALRDAGHVVVALTPDSSVISIDQFADDLRPGARVVLLAGTEGQGLSEPALAAATVRVRIPMARGTDSLNLATATGIALHRVFSRFTESGVLSRQL